MEFTKVEVSMSSFLEVLGLGVGTAIGGQFATEQYRGNLQQEQVLLTAQQCYVPYPVHRCVHQNCPICAEEDRKKIKDFKFAELEKKKKEEDYKDRCDEYMKKFRLKWKKGE